MKPTSHRHVPPKDTRYECVCATRTRAFCLARAGKIQLNPSHPKLSSSPECALPSRIVKEQHSFQLCTSTKHRAERCTQSIGFRRQHSEDSKSAVVAHATVLSSDSRLLTWWSRTGSNRRPPACKAGALPTELRPRYPSVACYLLRPRKWWVWMDSNHRPPPYQDGALTS